VSSDFSYFDIEILPILPYISGQPRPQIGLSWKIQVKSLESAVLASPISVISEAANRKYAEYSVVGGLGCEGSM
jgi:hypothetical protein